MSFVFERPQSILGESMARGEASLGDIFSASVDQMRLVDNTIAGERALSEAYDARINAIEAATGQRLDNPMARPIDDWIDTSIARPLIGSEAGRQDAMAAFDQQLTDLASRFPDAAEVIAPGRPIREDALGIARQADERLATLFESREGFDRWVAALSGGFVGALSDPWAQASLGLGAGPSAARTAVGRILSVAAREAAVNAGVEAAMQPVVQNWRREAGLAHGFDQALANVGLAGVFGGAFGGVLAGAGEGVAALMRRRLGPLERDAVAAELAGDGRVAPDMREALAGNPAAAARVLEPVREALPPAARGALDQAQIEATVVAPARTAAIETERTTIAERSLPPAERPEVFPEGDARLAEMDRESQRIEANWRIASQTDRIDEIEARLANDEIADDIARDFVRRDGQPAQLIDPARQMIRDVQTKLEIPSQDSEAFTAWRDDYLAREDVRARRDAPPTAERGVIQDATAGSYQAQERATAGAVARRIDTASRAIDGDGRALEDLAQLDPVMRQRDPDNPAYPREGDIPGPEGIDDPFDMAAITRQLDELELDDDMLDISVPNDDGDMVPLRELLAEAGHDEALANFVALCRV